MTRMGWLLALLAASAPIQARAAFFQAGVKQTAGTRNYQGTDAYLDLGDVWSFKPGFSSFHSDLATGTLKTYSARFGYDNRVFGFGVTGGATPKVNGYGNHFEGIDAVISLSPTGSGPVKRIRGNEEGGGKARGKGLARVDLAASILHTEHNDDFAAGFVPRSRPIHIGQTDFNGSVGVSVLRNLMSVDVTKSVYDHDLAAVSARAPQVERLQGVYAVVQGFPDTSTHLKLEISEVPMVTPFISYTHTTFKLGQPASGAYTVGGYVEFDIVEVSASYQRYAQAGRADQNYYSLGASLRF